MVTGEDDRMAAASLYSIDLHGISAAPCRAELGGVRPYVRISAGMLSLSLDADIAWRLAKELGLAALAARKMESESEAES